MCRMHFAKGGSLLPRLFWIWFFLMSARALAAQRVTSVALATGGALQADVRATAAFSASAGVHWLVPWTVWLQYSVAEPEAGAEGTLRDVSLAVLPAWEPWQGRLLFGLGPSLHSLNRDYVGLADDSRTRVAATGIAGVRVPVAGPGVSLELVARADAIEPEPQFSALLGVRIRPGLRNTLMLGERKTPMQVAVHRAVWNDVLMQVILLQQDLESFTRIREIETGIELEFDQTQVTLYDDVARVARVLAAADPPVVVTVFAPNAGRAGAAVTAGSFPAERLRLQRDTRVYLRVEH